MDDQIKPMQGQGKSGTSGAGRHVPNGAACRAKAAGFGDYVDCLVHSHLSCPYALDFADGRLCMHEARWQIVERTNQGKTKSQGI